MTREEFKRHLKRDVHQGTGRTRSKTAAQTSAEIEQQTAEFLAKGGSIQREPRRRTKVVDLTWRNYAQTAMEDAE